MTEEELKKLEEFEDIFGNTPFQNIQKIKEYIQNNFVSVDLYNKEKENNKELKKANKKLQADIELKNETISKAIGHIEACKTSMGNYILSPNETEYLLEILKGENKNDTKNK